MQEEQNKKLRLRIRLKTGEEFEAEGDALFISRQKDAFLSLINGSQDAQPQTLPTSGATFAPQPSAQASLPQVLPPYLKTNRAQIRTEAKVINGAVQLPQEDMWDKMAYIDGDDIIIRRKDKTLKSSSAALIILGAAKVLKNQLQLSALELSKSLKLSGYLKEDRLDRALAAEIKDGTIIYEGSKRNRLYRLTQKGLAKAFTTAEKSLLAEEKQNLI